MPDLSRKHWLIPDPPDREFLERFSGVPHIVQLLLWQRGLRTPDDVEAFLQPDYATLGDPLTFGQMRHAVNRILAATTSGQHITIYGDYDADGVTSTAIMVEALRAYGANVDWYLPERLSEGYGLNLAAVEMLTKRGTELLITLDCGTSNVDEVKRAKELGLDVIIIDHHHQPATTPPADVIINPAFTDEQYPFRTLSSGGVAFALVRALNVISNNGASIGRTLSVGWEKWLLDLVAISTVADMMPLRGENRTLVRYGLLVLRKTKRPGLRALFSVIGSAVERADEYTIGFMIAPRLNAAGRLHHASIALELILASTVEVASILANQLQAINQDRQRLTEMAMAEALDQIDLERLPAAVTAFAPHWAPGILGLVAGRLSERLWRPVVVMAENDGQIIGSGRSVPGFNIMEVMDDGREHFLRFGGHPGACGFTLASVEGRTVFESWFQQRVVREWHPDEVQRQLPIDGIITLTDITPAALDDLEQLGPYGIDHPRPVFAVEAARVIQAASVGGDGQHLRLTVSTDGTTAHCIGFRMASRLAECAVGSTIDIALEPSWNVWQGRRDPQLKIIDLKPRP